MTDENRKMVAFHLLSTLQRIQTSDGYRYFAADVCRRLGLRTRVVHCLGKTYRCEREIAGELRTLLNERGVERLVAIAQRERAKDLELS